MLSVRDKSGLNLFFLGAVFLLFTFAVGWLRPESHDSQSTNQYAISVASMGLILGGVIRVRVGLGCLVIQIFNPELMVQDIGVSLGVIGVEFSGLLFSF